MKLVRSLFEILALSLELAAFAVFALIAQPSLSAEITIQERTLSANMGLENAASEFSPRLVVEANYDKESVMVSVPVGATLVFRLRGEEVIPVHVEIPDVNILSALSSEVLQ